jgi:hypothetical protein
MNQLLHQAKEINMENTTVSRIRGLASNFTHEEIEHCITQQLNEGKNSCLSESDADAALAILAKTSFVRSIVSKGVSLQLAMRELGARLRQFNN